MNDHYRSFLVILMGIMVVFATYTAVTFFKINDGLPFENYNGVSHYNKMDHTLTAHGTFDRNIRCNLTDFKVLLHSAGKILVLGPSDLKVAPPVAMDPGQDIPIRMELHLPQDIQPGRWNPVYMGHYTCKEGLFTAYKIQELIGNSVIIDRD